MCVKPKGITADVEEHKSVDNTTKALYYMLLILLVFVVYT